MDNFISFVSPPFPFKVSRMRETFTALVQIISTSSRPEKAGIAKDVLATMKENEVEPDDAVIAQIQR